LRPVVRPVEGSSALLLFRVCDGGQEANVTGRPVPRIALRPEEAAISVGLSRAEFYESVLPHLRTFKVGKARLVPVVELERWADREASRLAEVDR
jgi:hypothetical protein